MVLISKTAAVINTTINISPGTLGGFPGGRSVARLRNDSLNDTPMPIYICDLNSYCSDSPYKQYTNKELLISNNVNGPGSGNLRLIPFIIKTSASHIPEIQSVTTLATPGQILKGGFVLKFKHYTTTIIPHDASAQLVKRIIEDNLNMINPNAAVSVNRLDSSSAGVGLVNVTRSGSDPQEGFTWNITFTTAIGNIDQIQVKSYLIGKGASAYTRTLRDGNEIGGSFTLAFQGYNTDPIPAAATALELKEILLRIPVVSTAFVRRTDPTQNCDDGLCLNGPYPARGLLWSVYISTNATYNDITPTSPTSPIAQVSPINYVVDVLNSDLTGADTSIMIYHSGTSESPDSPLNLLNISSFSLAFGGAGGSYGGLGGSGYSENPVGSVYNTQELTDLLGGSGGCMSQSDIFQINAALGPGGGRGGNGGGAIEIISSNDLTIGSWGKIIARGESGKQSTNGGGGGGSGGAILLASATAIKVDGLLDVSGGDGAYGGADMAGGGK